MNNRRIMRYPSAGITRIRFEGMISAQMVGHPLTYTL